MIFTGGSCAGGDAAVFVLSQRWRGLMEGGGRRMEAGRGGAEIEMQMGFYQTAAG